MLARLLKLAFWAALLFALVMALLPQPPQLPGSPSDKVQHMLAFAVLTALALAAYPRASWLRIGLGLACFGAFIELAQLIPMLGREGSWLDLVADCGAVAAVLALGTPVRTLLLNSSKAGLQP
jgi:hypothetical protein